MSLQDHLLLWNHAALKVLDVRRATMQPGESLRDEQLPASFFLCTAQGMARVSLDGIAYEAERCHICHAGKGAWLAIDQVTRRLDYYIVLYKAVLPMPCSQELLRLQQTSDPFMLQYGFAPRYPVPLHHSAEQLHRHWQRSGPLEKFHVKALFHQFLYELLRQLQEQEGEPAQPRAVAQAIRFLEERYAEPITLDSLAAVLDCNARQLQRLFKAGLHIGPMEYLIQIRLEKAKALLQQLDVPLAQIAEAVGYTDSYYFSRVFKKHMGMSPSSFRAQIRETEQRRQNPSRLSRSHIVCGNVPMYSETGKNGSHDQQLKDVDLAHTLAPANRTADQPSAGYGTTREFEPGGGVAVHTHKIIKHRKGELVLQQAADKIAVLDYQYLDQLLALGKQPFASVLGTSEASRFPAHLSGKLAELKLLGTKDQPDLAAIAEAAPDLIICTEWQEHVYAELVKIAPTLMFDRNEDWRASLSVLGSIVGRERETRNVIDAYNQKIVQLKEALAAKLGGQTVSFIRARDNKIRLHMTSHRTAKILYRDLGIAAPAMAVDSNRTSAFIGLDALRELNADRLFVLTDDSNAALMDEYQQTAIWRDLHAVQANRVRKVNTTLWTGYYGPLAINLIVDDIAQALL